MDNACISAGCSRDSIMSSTITTPFLAGQTLAENALGPAVASLVAGGGPNRTNPATTPFSLYSLVLRGPSAPYPPLVVYIFPLSPSNIRREVVGKGNFYDVVGSPVNFGVNRIVDIYGQSPPTYNIGGTTGVKYHSRDGYIWSGLQSVQILSDIIAQYFSLNAAVTQAGGTNLFRLEFYDFYTGEFWEVVPLGPQGLSQSSARPQLVMYQFTLVGTTSLEQPIAPALDSLLKYITTPINQIFSSISSSVSNFLSSYQSSSPAPAK